MLDFQALMSPKIARNATEGDFCDVYIEHTSSTWFLISNQR